MYNGVEGEEARDWAGVSMPLLFGMGLRVEKSINTKGRDRCMPCWTGCSGFAMAWQSCGSRVASVRNTGSWLTACPEPEDGRDDGSRIGVAAMRGTSSSS
jgi:hypothetical protein